MNGKRTLGFLVIVWGILMSIPMSSGSRAKDFRVGYFQVSPHVMRDRNGEAKGLAVDYFLRIAEKMGLSDTRFKWLPLQRLVGALQHNQVDMALLLARNPEREAVFVYPRQPFCRARPGIAVPAAHGIETIESIDPLLTLSIQVSAGAYRSAFIQDPRIHLEPMHGDDYTPRCFLKLRRNRIDGCYQPDHYALLFEANKSTYRSRIRILTLPEPPIGLYSVFSRKSAASYLQSYEAALAEVVREISYEDLCRELIQRNAPE